MEITRVEHAVANLQIAAEQVEVLGAMMRVRRIAGSCREPAQQHRVAPVAIDGKHLDPSPRHWE